MTLSTNRERLLTQVLIGEVWPALGDRHAYRTDADGVPFLLPGMGGVTLGVHPGDGATGYAADHLEPGLSIRHREERANMALQFLTCVGNVVTVRSGPAAGAVGRVIGQHAYVLADFSESDLQQVCTGDQVVVHAYGQGLRLTDHPEIVVKNADPDLLEGLGITTGPDGRLRVPVAVRVPAEAIGAGTGMYSEYANTDLMGAYAGQGEDLSLGLELLRIGDVVVLEDQDHRYGRGYRPGCTTIGVISTGHCRLFGHGPGPSTLLSGPTAAFDVVDEPEANVSNAFTAMGVSA
ncbi:DUF4438 domain-containing protein [Nakamurella sp. PAMC28650]|uniref:DUF4438 family protein n=1 Tax=Nakamurella sp. PAMC28650 TaxID=2762325 RepID=UPI00164EACB1|nr:DUF4438 domain-containing protein [Nakamurella sp. PAMC28650]QNK82153.1 DUF4438 domain-containing protein [Nakamurella sp. PAMC28650]